MLDMTTIKKQILVLLALTFSSGQIFAEDWLPVKDVDLRIQENSALDFSKMFPVYTISESNRLQTTADGHLGNNQGTSQRMFCAVESFIKPRGGFPNKADADDLATELHRRGYNFVRLHMLDMALMAGATKDFGFNEKEMDKMFYLISALQKKGLYIELDAESSWNGGYSDVHFPFQKGKHAMQLEVYLSASEREHWKQLVKALLMRKNPYTGLPLLHDPSIALITLINEMGFYKQLRKFDLKSKLYPQKTSQRLDTAYQTWLQKKYSTVNALQKSWGLLSPDSFADVTYTFEPNTATQQADLTAFIYETEVVVQQEMIDFLRNLGFKGLITNLNSSKEILSGSARNQLDVVTLHAYHDHPRKENTGNGKSSPARRQNNSSSISDQLQYARQISPNRLKDKPFIVDEYNHPFPNPWRREAGIVFPAFAAFNDWDGICRFVNPVHLAYKQTNDMNAMISAFNVGMDPIARAGEVLSALLFRRGDVDVARWQAELIMNQKALMQKDINEAWPDAISSLSLSMALSSSWQDKLATQVNFTSPDAKVIAVPINKVLSDQEGTLNKIMGRKHQISGETDMGDHIKFWPDKKTFIVSSKRTIAAVFSDVDTTLTVSSVQLSNIHAAGLVSISSLDEQAVSKSSRLLLTFLTDAQNTGMEFSADKKVLEQHGRLPVKILHGNLSVSMNHDKALKLYALNLRGDRIKELPTQYKDHKISFHLDNQIKEWGPVVFFELASEKVH